MIVTCPGCASKYRVKNDSVPTDGARMKCPKCDTMFLAKPPPPGAGGGAPHLEEPSSQFQQIAPHSSPPMGAPHTPAPQAPAPIRSAGPVTALFGVVDPSQLPAEFQTPQSLGAAQSPDLSLAPKVRTPVTMPTPASRAPEPRKTPRGPSRMPIVVAALGGVTAICGLVLFSWTMEIVSLDAALTPIFAPLGAKPLAEDTVQLEELRDAAKVATERGDLVGAVLLWQRVDARAKDDRQARTEIAALREKLGEQQTR